MIPLTLPRNPRYGWIPDKPDKRDLQYSTIIVAVPPLPPETDVRANCSPVENQGMLGSCTANALVGNLEFLEKKNNHTLVNFSRLFLYYNERVLEHKEATDSGAQIRDGVKTLAKTGICLESLWPYIIAKFAVKPLQKAYKEAKHYEILKYFRVHGISEMKHTLATGYPFVFGFVVYDSFESPIVAQTGVVPMPAAKEQIVGGHAVMAVGYNDTSKQFLIRNSWGADWGLKGYCLMPYEYVTGANLASDFWTIRTME